MTAATPGRDRLAPGIPYIVTRGSGAIGLRRGDRIEVHEGGTLTRSDGAAWRSGWQGYSFAAEPDRAGIMERAAMLRRQADELEAMLSG